MNKSDFAKAIRREMRLKTTGDTMRMCYGRIVKDLGSKKWKFDPTDAIKRINFIEKHLKHTGLELGNTPMSLLFFQKFLLLCLYGFYKPDGSLRFNRVFLTCGRQNGKSTLISCVMLCHMIFDAKRFNNAILGIFYSATFQQALDLYAKAVRMLKDSKLDKPLGLLCHKEQIIDTDRRNELRPITSAYSSADGARATMLAGDEIATHKNSKLSLVLKSGIDKTKMLLSY